MKCLLIVSVNAFKLLCQSFGDGTRSTLADYSKLRRLSAIFANLVSGTRLILQRVVANSEWNQTEALVAQTRKRGLICPMLHQWACGKCPRNRVARLELPTTIA